jgi:hypothetical protein
MVGDAGGGRDGIHFGIICGTFQERCGFGCKGWGTRLNKKGLCLEGSPMSKTGKRGV